MVSRVSLVSLAAAFVAITALIGLLPVIGELVFGPVMAHPPPSQSERVVGGIRDLLFCSSLMLAYFMWLQRRRVTVLLCVTCIAIAGLTLLSPLLTIGRYLYANPVFDPMVSALQGAFPWLFLAALLAHPNVRGGFGEPVRIRFSLRWLFIAALAHVAIFITATSMMSVSPNAIETLLLLPSKILVGFVIRFDAGRSFLDGSYSAVGFLLHILGSALVWGCVFAFIYPHICTPGRKPSNQVMPRTAPRADA